MNADRDTGNIHRLYNCEELQQMYLHSIPAYVYYIRHLPTGKFYYGSRYKHIEKNRLPEEDFWNFYYSSSSEIKKMQKETGNESFEYKIIFTHVDPEVCFEYEQTLIKEHIKDPLCINKRYFDSINGVKVFCTYGKTLSSKGKPKKESTKEKMRKPKTMQHRDNISKAQLANGGNGPAKHKEESKNKTRETMKLKPPRPTKTCPHCLKEGGAIAMMRWHFDKCKEKINVNPTI